MLPRQPVEQLASLDVPQKSWAVLTLYMNVFAPTFYHVWSIALLSESRLPQSTCSCWMLLLEKRRHTANGLALSKRSLQESVTSMHAVQDISECSSSSKFLAHSICLCKWQERLWLPMSTVWLIQGIIVQNSIGIHLLPCTIKLWNRLDAEGFKSGGLCSFKSGSMLVFNWSLFLPSVLFISFPQWALSRSLRLFIRFRPSSRWGSHRILICNKNNNLDVFLTRVFIRLPLLA